MQSMVPGYLEASLEAFQHNQNQFRDALAGAFTGGPFAEMARRNMELFQAAAGGKQKPAEAPPAADRSTDRDEDEVARLKSELAALQAKVDKLGR